MGYFLVVLVIFKIIIIIIFFGSIINSSKEHHSSSMGESVEVYYWKTISVLSTNVSAICTFCSCGLL